MREISLHILDILQNSVAAGATLIQLDVIQHNSKDLLEVVIQDNGCGINAEMLPTVLDPFSTTRTTRKVGMGLSMFKLSAMQTGGDLHITSQPGNGTCVRVRCHPSHIDCPPMGDLAGTVQLQAIGSPQIRLIFTFQGDHGTFEMDTKQILDVLGPDIPLSSPQVAQWLKETLIEGIQSVNGGKEDEKH